MIWNDSPIQSLSMGMSIAESFRFRGKEPPSMPVKIVGFRTGRELIEAGTDQVGELGARSLIRCTPGFPQGLLWLAQKHLICS